MVSKLPFSLSIHDVDKHYICVLFCEIGLNDGMWDGGRGRRPSLGRVYHT